MNDAAATITALSKDFDAHIVQIKPGSAKKPATKYVSHGSVTKRLNAVCPGWSSRVTQMHTLVDQRGMLQCLGVTLELTIPGVGSREEFGAASTPRDFGTDAKNAMSDALKRCAMRFGVAIDLWEDMDEYDEDAAPEPANPPARQRAEPSPLPPPSRPAVAPPDDGPPAPAPVIPYTAGEYTKIVDKAWEWAEDGWTLTDIRNDLNKLRHRMTRGQRTDTLAELEKIEAKFPAHAPAGVAG